MKSAKPKEISQKSISEALSNVKESVKKPEVTLISYAMKMTIPTGNYANIQPEIVVKSTSIEEAHNFIAPHMNKLWKEYYMISERRVNINTPDVPKTPAQTQTPEPVKPQVEATPVSSVAFMKATSAVQSCLSVEALKLIDNQILISVKLTEEDKKALSPLVDNKYAELNGK